MRKQAQTTNVSWTQHSNSFPRLTSVLSHRFTGPQVLGAYLRTFSKRFCYLNNKSEFSQVVTGLGVKVMDRHPPLDFLRTAFPPGWDPHLLLFSPHKAQSCLCVFLIFHQDPSFHKWKDRETKFSFRKQQNNEAKPAWKGELLSNWDHVSLCPRGKWCLCWPQGVSERDLMTLLLPGMPQNVWDRNENPHLLLSSRVVTSPAH